MNFIKKTKIVATLGPASSTEDVLEKMIHEGVNVFRINFSHADYNDVSDRIKMIRKVDKKLNRNTSILADLQGPKLRVGKMEEGAFVEPGDEVVFLTDAPFVGNAKKAYMNYKNFPKDVSAGERILLDDGKLIFEVTATNKKNQVNAKVIQGGPFKSNKGVAEVTYDNEGRVIAVEKRLKNVTLPTQIQKIVYKRYDDWTIVQNKYNVSYKQGSEVEKSYVITIQKGNEKKRIRVNG